VFHSSSSGSSVFSSPVIAGFWLKVAALVREMCEIEGAGWGGELVRWGVVLEPQCSATWTDIAKATAPHPTADLTCCLPVHDGRPSA